MNILICIDDTDSIDSRGTGELAENIANNIESCGWGKTCAVTRHQLLLHKEIQYTSHNSSMCFSAAIQPEHLQNIISYAGDYLKNESEPESDPGLCVVVVDDLNNKKSLIDFGYKAKRIILTKENAYGLAKELNIHLSEHGGSGLGVIGALAGAALRLSGNDGWFKGAHKVKTSNSIIKVSELCSYNNIDRVKCIHGKYLDDNEEVVIGKLVKTMLIEGQAVVLVHKVDIEDNGAKWKTCGKQQLREYEEMKLNVDCK